MLTPREKQVFSSIKDLIRASSRGGKKGMSTRQISTFGGSCGTKMQARHMQQVQTMSGGTATLSSSDSAFVGGTHANTKLAFTASDRGRAIVRHKHAPRQQAAWGEEPDEEEVERQEQVGLEAVRQVGNDAVLLTAFT